MLKIRLPYDPALALPGVHPRGFKLYHRTTYPLVFIAALVMTLRSGSSLGVHLQMNDKENDHTHSRILFGAKKLLMAFAGK